MSARPAPPRTPKRAAADAPPRPDSTAIDALGPLSEDRLLGGRVALRQPVRGYRAAIDPVLLAAFVPARPGEHVLEGGIGAGAAALCLLARVAGARVSGIERDPALAALAADNAARAALADRLAACAGVLGTDAARRMLARLGPFDHAMTNPPHHGHGAGTASPEARRAAADRESAEMPLAAWLAALARPLRPGGTLSLVHRADRLDEALAALRAAGFGGILVLPVWPRAGQEARRVLLRGIKGGRGPCRLLPGLVLHPTEGTGYTAAAQAVLRHGAALGTGLARGEKRPDSGTESTRKR